MSFDVKDHLAPSIASLVVLLLISSNAVAGERVSLVNGFYAKGGCENPEYEFYLVNGMRYIIFENGVALVISTDMQRRGKYVLERVEDSKITFFYSWLEGGDLRYSESDRLEKEEAPDISILPEQPPEAWEVGSYRRCDAANSSVGFMHAEGLSFFRFLTDLNDTACGSGKEQCIEKLWSYIDVSGNGVLSQAELSRLIRILAYIGTVKGSGYISNDDLFGKVGLASMIAPFVAKSIIDGSDYNDDGQLALDELFIDREFSSASLAVEKMSFDMVVSALGSLFKGLTSLGGLL
ncbi:hypothetical protein [Halomonas cerina]|uniref:Ca2+-binding EF-hand superfamily protein n=1 Tax=Halomonas cerina TaxID=447424 RepID=A0A839VGF3_9GAMM|nr:hypothetical protein [Halomonas cerina]MBB3192409.1 Ca2+-binding EF-hand superfamily protein [Halomonas cerina]